MENKRPFEIHHLEFHGPANDAICSISARLDLFEMIWVKNGSGTVTFNATEHQVCENQICCIFPGQSYHFDANECIEGYRISFSEEFLLMADGHHYEPFVSTSYSVYDRLMIMNIGSDTERKMEEIVKAMVREYRNTLDFRSEILKGLLKIFIVYFSRKLETKEVVCSQGYDSDFFKTFVDLLEKNFLVKRNVAEYADELCVSPGYLSDTVKKISGYTASHHIQQRIILEAKRAAICSGESMKEIAYKLGFSDIAHFSKFFKNKCGVNFSDFKKAIA